MSKEQKQPNSKAEPFRFRVSTAGGFRLADAWRTDTPGLVVHPALLGKLWMISHEGSGCGIMAAQSFVDALSYARGLGRCGDWTRAGAHLKQDKPFLKAAKAYRDKHRVDAVDDLLTAAQFADPEQPNVAAPALADPQPRPRER